MVFPENDHPGCYLNVGTASLSKIFLDMTVAVMTCCVHPRGSITDCYVLVSEAQTMINSICGGAQIPNS